MYKILLCCTSGLTSSKLVETMKKQADQEKLDVLVWTVAISAIELTWADADCILLAPQNESNLEKVKAVVTTSIPVAVIDGSDFSTMNGKAVLNQAIKLIKR